MKQNQRYLVLTLVTFMLAGCGLKGPLYMPSKTQSTEQPSQEQQTQEQQTQEQQSTTQQTNTVEPTV